MNCPAQADAARFVSWPQTSHGVTATGTCNAGYSGAPTRLCSNGAWSSTVTGSCIRTWFIISTADVADHAYRDYLRCGDWVPERRLAAYELWRLGCGHLRSRVQRFAGARVLHRGRLVVDGEPDLHSYVLARRACTTSDAGQKTCAGRRPTTTLFGRATRLR